MTTIFALHGFLGEPTDWNLFAQEIKKLGEYEIITPHLWREISQLEDSPTFESVTARLLKLIPDEATDVWLLGYSFGGRLALHMQSNARWTGAIMMSTHPGLISDEEKGLRLVRDQEWAERFLTEPFNDLVNEWQAQDVFLGDVPVDRSENEQWREPLALALSHLGTSRMENFKDVIESETRPQLWLVGERDEKFLALSQSIRWPPHSRRAVIKGCGHRINTTSPKAAAEFTHGFIEEHRQRGFYANGSVNESASEFGDPSTGVLDQAP